MVASMGHAADRLHHVPSCCCFCAGGGGAGAGAALQLEMEFIFSGLEEEALDISGDELRNSFSKGAPHSTPRHAAWHAEKHLQAA